MEKEINQLVEFVLDEICTGGDNGISVAELLYFIDKLYNVGSVDDKNRNGFVTEFSDSTAQNDLSLIPGSRRSTSKAEFKAKLWRSLAAHPDFIFGDNQCGTNEISLEELEKIQPEIPQAQLHDVEPVNNATITIPVDTDSGAVTTGRPSQELRGLEVPETNSSQLSFRPAGESSSLNVDSKNQPRIRVTKDRLWRTITGHAYDSNNISVDEWQCLCAIAAHRGNGILEAKLAEEVGLEKHNVSRHTKHLVERGYITKRKVNGHGPRNCLLTSKRCIQSPVADIHEAVHSPTSQTQEQIKSSNKATQRLASPKIVPESNQDNNVPNPDPALDSNVRSEDNSSPSNLNFPNTVKKAARAPPVPLRQSSRPSAPRKLQSSEVSRTPTITPSKRREAGSIDASSPLVTSGPSRLKQATSKSYDEYRRDEGIPGVYFDLPSLHRPTTVGRPKKTMIAVFKTNKLKTLPFMTTSLSAVTGSFYTHRNVTLTTNRATSSMPMVFTPATIDGRYQMVAALSAQQPPNLYASESYSDPTSVIRPPPKYPYLSNANLSSQTPYRSPYASVETILPDIQPHLLNDNQQPYIEIKENRLHPSTLDVEADANSFNFATDDEIRESLVAAETSLLPEYASRLASRMDDVVGNLCLSADMKTLTFVPSESQEDDEVKIGDMKKRASTFAVQISDIAKPPTISTEGTGPTEVLITIDGDEDDVEIVYRFRFLHDSMQTANSMRAKIVTAMTILEFTYDDSDGALSPIGQPPIRKPFKCDTCNGSWKNIEGLKYHKTKAMVSCNPNYKQPVQTPSRNRGKRKTAPKEPHSRPKDITEVGKALASNIDETRQTNETRSADSDFDIDSESIGSQSATKEPPIIRVSINDGNKDGSESGRTAIWETSIGTNVESKWHSTNKSSVIKRPTKRGNSSKNDAAVEATRRRKGVMISLLDGNSGVFPGDRGLWYGFVTSWITSFPHSGLPHYADTNATLALLEDSGQIQKISFSFRDDLGLMHTRTVITRRGIDPQSQSVIDTKESIKASFPEFFVPAKFAPPQTVRSMLDSIEARPRALREASTGTLSTDEAASLDAEANAEIVTFPSGIVEIDNEDEDVGSFHGRRRSQRSTRGRRGDWFAMSTPTPNRPKTSRSLTTPRGGMAYGDVEDHFVIPIIDDSDSDYLDDKYSTRQNRSQPPTGKDLQFQSPLQTWGSAMPFLQDPKRGSWSVIPPKSRRKKGITPRLPEPITYMQTVDNAAWSMRPFGHGVRPIFARPSKRVPGSGTYLEKIEGSFRPLLISSKKKFGPTTWNMIRPSIKNEAHFAQTPGMRNGNRKRSLPDSTDAQSLHNDHAPKRKYTRRASTSKKVAYDPLLRGSVGPDDIASASPLSNFRTPKAGLLSPSRSRKFRQKPPNPGLASLPSFSQLTKPPNISADPDFDFLKQTMLQSLSEIIAQSTYGHVESEKVPEIRWAAFIANVEGIEKWEQGEGMNLLGKGTIAPDYCFINLSLESLQQPYQGTIIRGRWFDRNSFTLETLPYGELETDSEDESSETSDFRYNKRPKRSKLHGISGLNKSSIRRLTAMPADVDGLLDIINSDPDLKVEIAHDKAMAMRKRADEESFSRSVEDRILLAVVVVRTLTGGVEKLVDWVLVSRLFPDLTSHFIQKRWNPMQEKNSAKIEKLSTDFQKFYVQAYEDGHVPAIDYNRLLEYDWETVLELFSRRVDLTPDEPIPPAAETLNLPSTRDGLDERYNINEITERPWRDDYHGFNTPVHKRMDFASSQTYMTPTHPVPSPDTGSPAFTIAKSWIRANSMTPIEKYNEARAKTKLNTLDRKLVLEAMQSLQDNKVLIGKNKGRATPGRLFDISEVFHSALHKHLNEQHFEEAFVFKTDLDLKLRQGQTALVPWIVDEGTILALTNMQSWGRVRLVPREVPQDKFGVVAQGNYQTKKMDKEKLWFKMAIEATDKYLYNDNHPLLRLLNRDDYAPPTGRSGELPVWYDIHGQVIAEMWRTVLCAVLGTLAFRPGMEVVEMERVLKPALEAWELRLLMDWACKVGVVAVLREGYEGWTVAEWWWLVCGAV